MAERVEKSEQEWRAQLTEDQYQVTRKAGTEAAFSGAYHDCKTAGEYHCVCCGQVLFAADTKFDSGTGWPSFSAPAQPEVVGEVADNRLFRSRTEVVCSRCDAHLGHVFDDGPDPTGLRYCINSVALSLNPEH